jgi:asparagine synthase (glutamine-hydrolysing)
MCGIAGGVAIRRDARPDHERVRQLSCRLTHRGPDGEGLWISPSGQACLAHRRLSVIDLATGQQPMSSADGTLGLVFNGEIYNYKELRHELAAKGSRFVTDSDTEVLLRDFERMGEACIEDLRGMFAFAVWDDTRHQLTIARDRIGKKPLYYVVEDGCLYFASSISSLRDTSPRKWEIDVQAVDSYLAFGFVPAPATIFRGVHKMEAGTVLTAIDGKISMRRYWDLATDSSRFSGTYEQAVDQLDALLNESVALRLRSDVPLGVFLSGGIDSSLVAAVAAKQSSTPVMTFSIGMDVSAFDESPFAAEVARLLGTEHRLFRAQPELMATLPAMVWHYGEPFADSSALPTWMLSQHTREHVTVALGGDGGDEGFAGYNWYQTALKLGRMGRGIPERAFSVAASAVGGVMRTGLPMSRRAGQMQRGLRMLGVPAGGSRFAALRSYVGSAESHALYAGELAALRRDEPAGHAAAHLASLYDSASGSEIRRMRFADMSTYLADELMPKVDVASMAHSLEVRAPLLDQEIIRFAMTLPDEWLIGPGGGKRILRTLLGRYLPISLFERPKQGFSIPLKNWFATSVYDSVAALSRSERLMDTGWFNGRGIDALVRENASGERDTSELLYSLLFLDEWLKRA